MTTSLLIYNVTDTVGKQIASYREIYCSAVIIFIIVFRLINVFLFVYVANGGAAYPFLTTDWWALVNNVIFGLTNGFCTTALFVLGPEVVQSSMKEAAGFMMVLGLLGGIFIGNIVALFLQNIYFD